MVVSGALLALVNLRYMPLVHCLHQCTVSNNDAVQALPSCVCNLNATAQMESCMSVSSSPTPRAQPVAKVCRRVQTFIPVAKVCRRVQTFVPDATTELWGFSWNLLSGRNIKQEVQGNQALS